MHEILIEGFSLYKWRSASLEALERSGAREDERSGAREDQAWNNRR